MIADFLAAVLDGTQPMTAGTDNIHSLAMVLGAIASADSAQRVALAR